MKDLHENTNEIVKLKVSRSANRREISRLMGEIKVLKNRIAANETKRAEIAANLARLERELKQL